jgi:hypothetical protein
MFFDDRLGPAARDLRRDRRKRASLLFSAKCVSPQWGAGDTGRQEMTRFRVLLTRLLNTGPVNDCSCLSRAGLEPDLGIDKI